MAKRKKKTNTYKKKQSGFSAKKVLLLLIIVLSITGCIKIALAYKTEQETTKKKTIQHQVVEKKKDETIIGQRKREKEIYGVDSQKVWNALNAYDYENGGKKEVFLTFDDGPSLTNTPNVLKILKDNNVKGTFFVIGKSLRIDGAPNILKDIYNQGHAIGNHSYSHDYSYLYPSRVLSMENFSSDFKKNDDLIKASLDMENFSTRVIRCPGGQISWQKTEPLNEYLIKNNKASIDWNCLNGDAEGPKKNADQLYDEAVKSSQNKNLVVLLMHDTYGKEETVKSLDKIIKYYKSQGYEFKTLV
ncbi:polysaccharide deacetylase family protein [Peptostreptococcus canis]|uniref:Polysaccharide deacetylase n=1 Tax=Peptostreptococcus canis TaxID=1159213 RepID=A0ABR6TN03_9FIRM|nr:polysaccharide deacetylase family protein [Peptostreptococcus canis]MBC2576793.1 polysaccharide deacetylase [Peptostreptococcus canis]MBP1998904.1 peptidoglycan/xylan/chitin deacetylase (PgdA/CDA1 family) [Peptostreptococcus canis]